MVDSSPGSAPRFEQVFGSTLFAMPPSRGHAWSAFLPARGAALPAEPVSVPESWKLEGQYLFAPEPPKLAGREEAEALAASVYEWLDKAFAKRSRFEGRACVWLPGGAAPPGPPLDPRTHAFTFITDPSASSTSDLNVVLGNQLTLAVPSSTLLGATETALELRGLGSRVLQFVTSEGGEVAGLTVKPNAATLPFAGPHTGALIVEGSIDLGLLLDQFEAGVRYGHGDTNGAPNVQRFPLLAPEGEVPYCGAIDPLDPLNTGPAADVAEGRLRTLLAPRLPQEAGRALPSYLRTAQGKHVGLLPVGAESGWPEAPAGALVFQPVGLGDDAEDVCLTLGGDWVPVVEAAAETEEVLCGLFGLERLSVRPLRQGPPFDSLRFMPNRPAFAVGFPPAETSLTDPTEPGPLLSDELQTAWVATVSGDEEVTGYLSQPSGSPLFAPGVSNSSTDTALLGWHGPTTPLEKVPLPLAPYAGLPKPPGGLAEADLGPFESQVLAAERRRQTLPKAVGHLRAEKANLTGEEEVTATTPQGFLAKMSGAVYSLVTLAHSGEGIRDFAFADPDPELQALLQTNQLMGVVADPKHLSGFADGVEIAGWRMTAAIGNSSTASDAHNVMLLKFCHGALVERVADPSTWTAPELFSTLGEPSEWAVSALSTWLQKYFEQGIEEHEDGNSLYDEFARVARDPEWQGILVLRADLSVDGLPDQIRGLAAGIDLKSLNAHHFGVTVTPIEVNAGKLEVEGPSSLFGLVDYQLPQFRQNVASGGNPDTPLPLPTDGPFGFSVLELQALFRNAALADFRSRVQLTVNELFGSAVLSTHSGGKRVGAKAVVLDGSYQRQGDSSTYVFEQNDPSVFALDSNALRAVAFDRIQFNTVSAPAEAARTLRSRFLIWGALDFAAVEGAGAEAFDVYSFGSAAGTPVEQLGVGLAFSNLQVELTSQVATPNAVTFAFEPGALAFDAAASAPYARDGSLFKTFSLQLDSFLAPAEGKRPADLNYLPVSLSAPTAALAGPWFGVVTKVTMGTAGALAAAAGFDSRMLIGWSPKTKASEPRPAAFAGLQLPGAAPGAKLMSIQGVLRVTVGSLGLQREPVQGSPSASAFVLRLSDVGLTFLGVAKLPPGAVINFFLFGDPKGTGSLGWYAAYTKEKESGLLELAR